MLENLKMVHAVIIIFITAAIFDENSAYRILGIFPLNSRSHEMMFESLMTGLAKRGHQVDVVTHFPVENPPKNYKNIVNLSGTMDNLVNSFTINFSKNLAGDIGYYIATLYGNELCYLLGQNDMQELIKNPPSDPPYDVLITEVSNWIS